MKTSKKILIIVAGILIVIVITTMSVLRRDLKILLKDQEMIEYKSVPVDKFVSLDFSDNWIVQIKQGKDCKVELAMKKGNNVHPKMETSNGTLFLSLEESPGKEKTGVIYARVTAPFLNIIKAEGNTEILMKNFWSDSIHVVLKDSSKFSGKNNDFTNIFFKTSDHE